VNEKTKKIKDQASGRFKGHSKPTKHAFKSTKRFKRR